MSSDNSEKGLSIRRVYHLFFGLVIIYYIFPSTIFGIPTYIYFITFFLIIPLCIEVIRLNKGILFLGLHDHERDHLASYVWFCLGANILILFFPQQIAAPCIFVSDACVMPVKPNRNIKNIVVLIAFKFLIFFSF